MLHRAILGSFERFIGILIDHFGGRFPFWLSPKQVAIATVTEKVADYAKKIEKELKKIGIRVILDNSADKISYKIRKYSTEKIPMIFILGEQEKEKGNCANKRIS